MKAIVLGIGDELLIGQVINSNAAWISQHLVQFGIETVEHRSIPDDYAAIHHHVESGLQIAGLIICTGGLGPTKDDITKKALADYFDMPLAFDQVMYDRIEEIFSTRNIPMTDLHRQQCFMPARCVQLENQLGTAPGMLFSKNNKHVISLPGVPYEMKNILSVSTLPYLDQWTPSDKPYFKTIMTSGWGETRIATAIEDITESFPEGVSISYLPSYGSVRLRINDRRGTSDNDVLDHLTQQITERLGHKVYGYDDQSMISVLADTLRSQGKTVAVAESCTGGMLGDLFTTESGISDVFAGGVISYSNHLKTQFLDVPEDLLTTYGAVSAECVAAMLSGLLQKTGADVGISISGIAGPGGGTPDKPVGTIWIGYGDAQQIRTKKILINRNRTVNRKYACAVALNLLRLHLQSDFTA